MCRYAASRMQRRARKTKRPPLPAGRCLIALKANGENPMQSESQSFLSCSGRTGRHAHKTHRSGGDASVIQRATGPTGSSRRPVRRARASRGGGSRGPVRSSSRLASARALFPGTLRYSTYPARFHGELTVRVNSRTATRAAFHLVNTPRSHSMSKRARTRAESDSSTDSTVRVSRSVARWGLRAKRQTWWSKAASNPKRLRLLWLTESRPPSTLAIHVGS